jgi:hypothetical protein
MEHNKGRCKICGHGMIEHGVDYAYRGYCANGNDGDCDCREKGLSYIEALNEL